MIRLQPLRQAGLIDVASWEQDAEFGVFPQGARAKDAVFSQAEPLDTVLVPNKRYLFKHSKKSYPDQFWDEIIAYRVGCLMGLEVPPTFVAWNSSTKISAALIEWFYVDGEEVSSLAGDLLQKIQPDFDRGKGSTHNLRQVIPLLRAFVQANLMENNWRQWWTDALLFDALIGNTDRHQDNWGFLFRTRENGLPRVRFMPLFDNGTSLGHERFVEKVAGWKTEDYQRYIRKGTHHVSWSLEEPRIKGHMELLERVLAEWPETRSLAQARLAEVTETNLLDVLSDLMHIRAPVSLSQARFDFILRLLNYRLINLKVLLL
ncbi:MAG: HipA domain-containing protein [Sulfuricellaceae bacterium]|nr:HipA domain-containing protein [Sulfuricellaceae bacterium]